ncbi:PAS domain-containing protein [Streptomyces sp. MS1.HAVA.3]|uniref:PAS domain-containing protein n=1 Tax=Streptomyces caledonius TaxID=3134107 RepID=A0ABU8TZZ4_9ACTN
MGLAVFDTDLRLLRTNTHLLPYTGVPVDLNGRRLADFLWAEDARIIDDRLREVMHSGNPLTGFNTTVRTLDDPRGGRVVTIQAFRLQEPDGHPMGVATVFTDVTDHERSRGRLDLLYRATGALGGSLSVLRTVEDLVKVLAPAFGDCAAVDLVETVLTGGEPSADGHLTLPLIRMAVAGAGADALRTGTAHFTTPLTAAVTPPTVTEPAAPETRECRGELITDLGTRSTGPVADPAPEWATTVPDAHSAMTAPLCARGIRFGRLTLWRTGPLPRWRRTTWHFWRRSPPVPPSPWTTRGATPRNAAPLWACSAAFCHRPPRRRPRWKRPASTCPPTWTAAWAATGSTSSPCRRPVSPWWSGMSPDTGCTPRP